MIKKKLGELFDSLEDIGKERMLTMFGISISVKQMLTG